MLFNSGKKQFLAKWRGVNLFYSHLERGTRIILAVAVVVALLTIAYLLQGIFHKQKASADLAKFYPAKCLGGWQYTAHAENVPDLDTVASIDDFNDINSAVLDNAMAQLYCSNFNGENPIGTVPKKLTLRLSLAVKPKVVMEAPLESENPSPSVIQEPVVNDDAGATPSETPVSETPVSEPVPTEPAVLDSPEPAPAETPTTAPSEPVSAPVEAPVSETPAVAPVEAPAAPASEPAPAPASSPEPTSLLPQSLLDRLFAWFTVATVRAEEAVSSTPEEIVTSDEVVEVASSTSEVQISSSSETISEASSTVPIEESKIEEVAIVMPSDALLEVSYTLDGQTWQSLGWVVESNWRDARFDLPLEGISDWSKLDMLQVRFDRVATLNDNQPIFYLDGMWLEAEYDAAIKEKVDPGVDQPDLLKDEVLKKKEGKDFVVVNVIREESGEQELWYGSTVDVENSDHFAGVSLWKKIELKEGETKPLLLDARAGMMFWVVDFDGKKRLYNREFKTGSAASVDANDDGSAQMNFDEDAYDGSGLRLTHLNYVNDENYSFSQ